MFHTILIYHLKNTPLFLQNAKCTVKQNSQLKRNQTSHQPSHLLLSHKQCYHMTPVFTLTLDKARDILDKHCQHEVFKFHNRNWVIISHFFLDDNNDNDIFVELLNCNHKISFNSIIVSEITFNYSCSIAPRAHKWKHLPNVDYDMKAFIAVTDEVLSFECHPHFNNGHCRLTSWPLPPLDTEQLASK